MSYWILLFTTLFPFQGKDILKENKNSLGMLFILGLVQSRFETASHHFELEKMLRILTFQKYDPYLNYFNLFYNFCSNKYQWPLNNKKLTVKLLTFDILSIISLSIKIWLSIWNGSQKIQNRKI